MTTTLKHSTVALCHFKKYSIVGAAEEVEEEAEEE